MKFIAGDTEKRPGGDADAGKRGTWYDKVASMKEWQVSTGTWY